MANSVMSKPSLQPRKGRNGFDLSFHRNYTAPLGALLPVFTDYAIVGDKYRLNTATFVRTEPLEKAAFARFKHHVDWFFIPMTQMFSLWNEFYNQTNDIMSSIFSAQVPNGYKWPRHNVFPAFSNFLLNSIDQFSDYDSTTKITKYYCDNFGVPYVWNLRRLWDMFGYGSLSMHGFGTSSNPEYFLLIPYLAYHKVFHSHYRPTQWFKNNPDLYNVDNSYANSGPTVASDFTRRILTTIHYRPYRKDYFTNVMPAPLYNELYPDYISDFGRKSGSADYSGGFSLRSLINPEVSSSSSSGFANGLFQSVYSSQGVSSADGSSMFLKNNSGDYAFSSSDIRTVFAFDKLLRVTAFAGSHYQDQVLAHYGIKIPEGISDEAYFLGSQSVPVVVNEVVATASTGATEDNKPLAGSTIGDIAGKGFTPSDQKIGKDINFTCPCDGVIIGIQSIELIPEYSSMFMERQHRYLDTFDFYHPELDGIGMQPMVVNDLGYSVSNSNDVKGWQYRYMEYKTKVDVCNEGFWDTNRYNWAPTKQSALALGNGVYSPAMNNSLYYKFFMFPQVANNIFLKKYPFYGSPGNTSGAAVLQDDNTSLGLVAYQTGSTSSQMCYENDPFLVSMDIKAFKTSVMSTFSLDKVL